MNSQDHRPEVHSNDGSGEVPANTIAQLVGQVYEAAPAPDRTRLISHLLRPLGLLALVGVANGAFAKVWLRSPGQGLQVQLDDVLRVGPEDVTALVNFVQQVSTEAIDGLVQIVSTSPVLSATAAAQLLVFVLLRRLQNRSREASVTGHDSAPHNA